MFRFVSVFLLLGAVTAIPTKDELMLDLGDDTAVVESTVRETRAAVPERIEDLIEPGVKEAFLHTFGDKEGDDGDVQGYRKKTQDKGSDGYKHFDSYHKKDGDKYGYETHSEYGKGNKAGAEGSGKAKKYSNAYESDDDEAETKKAYQVIEKEKEGKKGVRAIEDYEGDSGYYADSGDYSEGDGESAGYAEGGDAESEYYGGNDEGEGDSGNYAAEDGEANVEYEDDYSEAEEDY